jgi:hypothetical protein
MSRRVASDEAKRQSVACQGIQSITILDAAQYGMIVSARMKEAANAPTEQLLETIRESSRAQRLLDLEHYIHWSRHLLAYLDKETSARLLISASAMTFNPHFPFFCFSQCGRPDIGRIWPMASYPSGPALLLRDSFPRSSRPALLAQAAEHAPGVWILTSAKERDLPSNLPELQRVRAVKLVELPSESRIVHKDSCWEETHWDTYPMPYKAQGIAAQC